jgi:hypothetical protein
MILGDYEWQFFQAFGKMGLKLESGLMAASGNGRFATAVDRPDGTSTTEAKEKYTFMLFPNSLALIYRLDLFHRQWIVPFAEGGIDYYTFCEFRDDGNVFKFGGDTLYHIAVGGSFLLDLLSREAIVQIDHSYGVNHLWLTGEYRHIGQIRGLYDFTDDVINAGFMFEF